MREREKLIGTSRRRISRHIHRSISRHISHHHTSRHISHHHIHNRTISDTWPPVLFFSFCIIRCNVIFISFFIMLRNIYFSWLMVCDVIALDSSSEIVSSSGIVSSAGIIASTEIVSSAGIVCHVFFAFVAVVGAARDVLVVVVGIVRDVFVVVAAGVLRDVVVMAAGVVVAAGAFIIAGSDFVRRDGTSLEFNVSITAIHARR